VTELAAYGLTLVAICTLMPGRRVKAMNQGSAPDLLFDVTPGVFAESSPRAVQPGGAGRCSPSAMVPPRRAKRAQPWEKRHSSGRGATSSRSIFPSGVLLPGSASWSR
jgi:hypothetical protein